MICGWRITIKAKLIASLALVAAAAMALGSTAAAKSLYFVGHADDDSDTTIHFRAKGKYERKKGSKKKKFVAKEVSLIRVYDQHFICWTANGSPTGISGRHTYGYAFIDPLEVEKKGRFGGFYQNVYRSPYGGDPLTLEYDRFRGRIKGKTATGAYQTQASEGGIEFGYCGDRDPVNWTAKAQKKAPEPPPDPLRAGLGGGYSGKIKHGGPMDRKIAFRVTKKRAKLVELPLDLDCRFVHDERIREVIKGGSGKLKRQFKELGGETNFKIRKRVKDFHDGTLKVRVDAGFRGGKIAGVFDASLDYGSLGNCSDGGNFKAGK